MIFFLPYISAIFFYLFIVFSLYAILDVNTMIKIGSENGIIENITFFFFLITSFLFARTYLVSKNFFFLFLCLVFLIGAGEEISWGQRIFSFSTPESLSEINIQKEFNIHNIETFSGHDFDGNTKKGWAKLYSINFLYKVFWLSFGIIIPLFVMFGKAASVSKRLKFPVPPLPIGAFFLVNWLTFKIITEYYLKLGEYPAAYIYTSTEIMESGTAAIFLVISYYFFRIEKLKLF